VSPGAAVTGSVAAASPSSYPQPPAIHHRLPHFAAAPLQLLWQRGHVLLRSAMEVCIFSLLRQFWQQRVDSFFGFF